MDTGRLNWTSEGLFFADTERDYLLNESLQSWDNPKPNLQDLALETPEGILSVYNDGFDGEVYTETVTLSGSGGPETTHTIDGYNQIFALCDQDLVGIAELSGPDLTTAATDAGLIDKPSVGDLMLTRLYPSRATPQETLASAVHSEAGAFTHGLVPCTDGVVTYFWTPENDSGAGLTTVTRWNTRTGKRSSAILTMPDQTRLTWNNDGLNPFSGTVYAPDLDADGRLVWFGGDGVMRATDPDSGLTTELWRSPLPAEPRDPTSIRFAGSDLLLLEVPSDLDQPVVLHRFDILSGQDDIVVTIPELNRRTSLDLVVRGVAVRPGLAG